MPISDETTLQFLTRRKGELSAQIAALRGQLVPKETELIDVNRMLGEITPGSKEANAKVYIPSPEDRELAGKVLEQFRKGPSSADVIRTAIEAMNRAAQIAPSPEIKQAYEKFLAFLEGIGRAAKTKFEGSTIKELVVQALIDDFPNGGKASEIRDFIRAGYGRDIDAASLRPQMHRLKADKVLTQDGEIWNLDPQRRNLYARYNHPRTRAAMPELRDDENAKPMTALHDIQA